MKTKYIIYFRDTRQFLGVLANTDDTQKAKTFDSVQEAKEYGKCILSTKWEVRPQ